MLTNFEIETLTENFHLPLVGVYQKNLLKYVPRQLGSYYINQMSSTEGDGSHWVFFRIYSDTEDEINEAKALYFDPLGLAMSQEVEEYLKPFIPIPYNTTQIQSPRTTECGWYCLACDIFLKNGEGPYLNRFETFLDEFSEDVNKNLQKLKLFFSEI